MNLPPFHRTSALLPDCRRFHEHVGQLIARAGRDGSRFSLLLFQLDWPAGMPVSLSVGAHDRVLAETVRRLRETAGEAAVVARVGDLEFAVLAENVHGRAKVAARAARIGSILSAPFAEGDCRLLVSAGIGIADFPDHGKSVDTLIGHAREATRRARSDGNGDHGLAAMPLTVAMRLRLIARLRRSLPCGEGFSVVWRPRVRIAQNTLAGVQAALHWDDVELGAVAPDVLLPLAERGGLMADIDRWTLAAAAREASPWLNARDGRASSITLGLSSAFLQRSTAIDEILAVLREHALRPGQLWLDLAEHTLDDLDAGGWRAIAHLAAAGVRFAVKDCGSGKSNLVRLARLAPHGLKISPALIHNLAASTTDRAVAATVAFFGRQLGTRLMAEGVDTAAELDQLRTLGCDEAQGDLFGPATALDTLRQVWSPSRP